MEKKIKSYKDLIVWQKSMSLVEIVYKYSKSFPKEELYGLTSQIRRCAISIPSNIAEGSRRSTRKDFSHFISISYGSASELETQIELSKRLGYLNDSEFERLNGVMDEVLKMLNKLSSSLQTTNYKL